MASIEEDDDLIALRSAVLASMKVKPKVKEVESFEEEAELLELRHAALQSKRYQNDEDQDGPIHTEQMAICHAPRLVAPPKPFQPSQGGDRNNLIVIPLVQEERTALAQGRTTHESQRQQPIQRQQAPTRKPTLILPQDKWAGGSVGGASAAEHTSTKASSKFSRFESRDSDSDEDDDDDEGEDSDKSEEVDLLEKQMEQFLQDTSDKDETSDKDDSGGENDGSPVAKAGRECESPTAVPENDCSLGDAPDGDSVCAEDVAADVGGESSKEIVNSCDKNNVADTVKESPEPDNNIRSRSSSSSSSGSSSSGGSSCSSSSWSSGSSGSRPHSVSPVRHKSAVGAGGRDSKETSAKTVAKHTMRERTKTPGEQRVHQMNWTNTSDSRSVSLKVIEGRSSPHRDKCRWSRSPCDATQPGRKQAAGEAASRKHPRDRLGQRATPTSDVAAKDAREKLEDRKRKFASSKTVPESRGKTVVLKGDLSSVKAAPDKENHRTNVKLRLGAETCGSRVRKDNRTRTDGVNSRPAEPQPLLTRLKERSGSFKSDDFSDSDDLFSFSDSDSDDAASAPYRQKKVLERDEKQLSQERFIRRRHDRGVEAALVAPHGGVSAIVDRSSRQGGRTPPLAKHAKHRDNRVWARHRGESSSDGDADTQEKDRTVPRSVMSLVKKNAADVHNDRGGSSSREQTRRRRKDKSVVVHVNEPRTVVQEDRSLATKRKKSREEDARSIIQRLKRKGGETEVEVELVRKNVKKSRKTALVVGRISPTISITFNKDADLLKPDARMSVHERLGGARKRRHGKASSPPPPTVPLTTASGSRDHYTRKVVRYDDRSSDDDRKEKNGSRLTEGKTFVTHQVSPPADKEAHSRKKKKTPLVLKTIVRRERHEPDVTHRDKRDRHSRDRHSRDRVSNKKPTGHHYESDLDVKIRKIKEKNDQIMRRKRQIEEDKKKYG